MQVSSVLASLYGCAFDPSHPLAYIQSHWTLACSSELSEQGIFNGTASIRAARSPLRPIPVSFRSRVGDFVNTLSQSCDGQAVSVSRDGVDGSPGCVANGNAQLRLWLPIARQEAPAYQSPSSRRSSLRARAEPGCQILETGPHALPPGLHSALWPRLQWALRMMPTHDATLRACFGFRLVPRHPGG